MQVKLMMYWDIQQGQDQEYFEFMVREWVPTTSEMGLKTIGAWYTRYSREPGPQICIEAIADDIKVMRDILNSPDWARLHDKLSTYITNYSRKVVKLSNGFQL